jgi:ketosteroid isomerase-like protein
MLKLIHWNGQRVHLSNNTNLTYHVLTRRKLMYRSKWLFLLVVVLALVFAACQPVMPESVVVAQSATDEGALEAARAASAAFGSVYGQGDAAAVAALYTGDAMVMAPNSEIITGEEDITAFWQGAMDAGVTVFQTVTEEMEVLGDTAIERGTAQLFLADGTSVETAKYILIWKEVDGEWLLHRDIWNSNLPAPAPQEASEASGECSLSTLQGTYMFHGRGMTSDGEAIVPYAEAGIIHLDGEGNQEGIFSTSIDGVAVDQQNAFSGTYEVAAQLEAGCAITAYAPVGDEVLVFHYYTTQEGDSWTYHSSGFSGIAVKQ